MPEQPRGLFERRVLRQIANLKAGDHQLSPLPVDEAETSGCRDDAFETAVYHSAQASVESESVSTLSGLVASVDGSQAAGGCDVARCHQPLGRDDRPVGQSSEVVLASLSCS